MIKEQLTLALKDIAAAIVKEAGFAVPDQLNIVVEHPASEANGEYSSSIAMQMAKLLKRSPVAIAGDFKAKLESNATVKGLFSYIAVAPPGFINFYVDWEQWAARVQQGENESLKKQPNKVLIEHTSINPNKSAHIGHLRNSCIGDTLARLLKKAGCRVEVHNYIDDLGNQLADTVVGLLHTPAEQHYARFGDFCWDTYAKVNKAYKETPELLHERTTVLERLEEGGNNTAWIGLLVAEKIVREHVEEMKQFGIHYDVLVWESSIVSGGFWQRAFELLIKTDVFRQESAGKLAGCWVLKQGKATSDGNDETDYQNDKVLVRSNGILTYTAKDIAYHLWKFGLLDNDFRYKRFGDRLWSTDAAGTAKPFGRADAVINVIDERQKYPQEMVKQALIALGYDNEAANLNHVGYGVVSLSAATARNLDVDTSDGKHAYPMSGRQGVGIKVSDLLERMEAVIDGKRSRKAGLSSRAIASAAIRYYLLRFHLQTEIVFDLEQATEVTGNTGVYLLYSFARARSIMDKVRKEGSAMQLAAFGTLEKQERSVLRQLSYWPETLQAAEKELSPTLICTYAYELATAFNHFYAVCPILKAEPDKLNFRLWLTQRYEQTLREALEILGLPTPNRM